MDNLFPSTLTAAIATLAMEGLRKFWVLQGHRLTKSWENSLEYAVTQKADEIGIDISFNDYGQYVQSGVPASRIKSPFAPARIKGLTDFAKQRFGVSRKEAERIAYAIASKHKREGMPTRASRRFSRAPGNKRTGFIDQAIVEMEPKIEAMVGVAVEESYDSMLTSFFKDILKR